MSKNFGCKNIFFYFKLKKTFISPTKKAESRKQKAEKEKNTPLHY